MHVLSCKREGALPVVLNIHTTDSRKARSLAERICRLGMARVVLHSLNTSTGMLTVTGVWERENGKAVPVDTPVVPQHQMAVEMVSEDTPAADDSGDVFNGYCMKCHEKRDFHGEIVETANGRRMAKGQCPVCGKGIMRILGKAAEPEWEDAPVAEITAEQAQESEAVAVAAENAANAAAAAVVESAAEAVEFSDTQAEVQEAVSTPAKKAPAKRASRKKTVAAQTENGAVPPDVADFQETVECLHCHQQVPVKTAANVKYLMVHSAPGVERCIGSMADVKEMVPA